MNEPKLTIAANSVVGIADIAAMEVDEILEVLEGIVFSEEECGQIRERIASV